MLTLITFPPQAPLQPELHAAFPTVGKLMIEADYDTPYFGKWHLSYDAADLGRYGFESHTPSQDYVGYPGQGLHDDGTIATDAASWVTQRVKSGNVKPFFLPVNFVNPHDKQWFWGAMQGNTFNEVYYKNLPGENPPQTGNPPAPYTDVIPENHPPQRGYSPDITEAIPNWETENVLLSTKPRTQTLIREVFQYQNGGMYEDDKASTYTSVKYPVGFYYADTPIHEGEHKAIAPSEYWTMALDSYIQVMKMVDDAIGTFMQNIPDVIKQNAVFIVTADHGEYASSHGLQGKGGTVYEEGIRVPLIVYDPLGQFTNSAPYRTQLCSSVDLLRMIVTMGHRGNTDWLTGNYEQLYGSRCDLLSILSNPDAAGRAYVLHSTDEFIPDKFNYLHAPLHVIGQISMDDQGHKQKLGVYTRWEEFSEEQSQAIVLNNAATEVEYYDYTNEQNEVESTPHSARAEAALRTLFGGPSEILPLLSSELQAPLPEAYQEAQRRAYHALCHYMRLVNVEAELSETDAVKKSDDLLERVGTL